MARSPASVRRAAVVIAIVVLAVAGAALTFVRLDPFNPWRVGSTHEGRVQIDGCTRFEAAGATASERWGMPWVADDSPTNPRPAVPTPAAPTPTSAPELHGTLEVVDATHAVFTATSGERVTFRRGFCRTATELCRPRFTVAVVAVIRSCA